MLTGARIMFLVTRSFQPLCIKVFHDAHIRSKSDVYSLSLVLRGNRGAPFEDEIPIETNRTSAYFSSL